MNMSMCLKTLPHTLNVCTYIVCLTCKDNIISFIYTAAGRTKNLASDSNSSWSGDLNVFFLFYYSHPFNSPKIFNQTHLNNFDSHFLCVTNIVAPPPFFLKKTAVFFPVRRYTKKKKHVLDFMMTCKQQQKQQQQQQQQQQHRQTQPEMLKEGKKTKTWTRWKRRINSR